MSRSMRRRVVASLLVGIPVSLAGLSAAARQSGKRQAPEVNRAKEIAFLIAQGQLNLRAATELAEKYVKGTALEAKCDFQPDASEEPDCGDMANPQANDDQYAGQRLIYEVYCFANDKLQVVRVDALDKTVIESR